MGPVWEANHVWLIFVITGFFTAFPIAFGHLALAFYLPFTIALAGIVLRGASFAFRAHGSEAVGSRSSWGVVFGASSVIAPFFLATTLAAIASGAVRVRDGSLVSGFAAGWATPYGLLIGAFAVAICAYLAATYLIVETEGTSLEADFRRRALGSGIVAGVLSILGLALAPLVAPQLAHALFGLGLPLVLLALINGPVALWAVWRSRPRIARVAVAAQVVFVLWAWLVGQWPYLVPPDLTIAGSAAPQATLGAWLVVVAIGATVLAPSLWFLFRLFKGKNPAAAGPY
jgi:cytochrome d ubiquinol oxidase subunit II